MSIASWKKEYYRTPADKPRSFLAAAEHSLRKWEGLRPENLKRHGLKQRDNALIELSGKTWFFDGHSCALCVVSRAATDDDHSFDISICSTLSNPCSVDDDHCSVCPLATIRGNAECDLNTGNEVYAPYTEMTENGNPEPMIAWLELTVRYLQHKKKGTIQ